MWPEAHYKAVLCAPLLKFSNTFTKYIGIVVAQDLKQKIMTMCMKVLPEAPHIGIARLLL